jgi:hypothetical protein
VQKVVWYPDGRTEGYSLVTHEQPAGYGRYVITDMWKDSDRDIWYTMKVQAEIFDTYYLARISDSGNTLETLYNSDPIEEWDPDNIRYQYRIRYRQE